MVTFINFILDSDRFIRDFFLVSKHVVLHTMFARFNFKRFLDVMSCVKKRIITQLFIERAAYRGMLIENALSLSRRRALINLNVIFIDCGTAREGYSWQLHRVCTPPLAY